MSRINYALEEAIAMKAEYTRCLAQEVGYNGKMKDEKKEAELWGAYKALCWVESLLDIDWEKYNSEAVKFTNRISSRATENDIEDIDLPDFSLEK